MVVDVPDEYVGTVTSHLGIRRGQMVKLHAIGAGRTRVEYLVPSRGLIGFRSLFLTETRGTGLLNTIFERWDPDRGSVLRRPGGAIVADRTGRTTPYALFHLQPRGELFIDPGTDVYEGMIVGIHNRPSDLDVNAVREKKLTNIRAAGRDENVILRSPAGSRSARARLHRSRRTGRSRRMRCVRKRSFRQHCPRRDDNE